MSLLDKVKILKLTNEIERLKKESTIKRLVELEEWFKEEKQTNLELSEKLEGANAVIGVLINLISKPITLSKRELYKKYPFEITEDYTNNSFIIKGGE